MKIIKILAVDLGLKTGVAVFNQDGVLTEYFSKRFSNRNVLKKAVYHILKTRPGITHLVIEGGGELVAAWVKNAQKMGIKVVQITAEEWRNAFLFEKERKSGKEAKKNADILARCVIEWAGIKKATSLQHDCAEAILAGFWVAYKMKLCQQVPRELEKRLATCSI